MSFPLYSTKYSRIIEGFSTTLTDPATGEKFGGADWLSAAKLTEVGAVTLRVQSASDGYSADGWEVIDDPTGVCVKLKRPTGETLIPAKTAEEIAAENAEAAASLLNDTDQSTVRVLEDLIALLASKNVIATSELPAAAQVKLAARQEAREGL